MTIVAICLTVVFVSGLTHHAFISALDLRERERLSAIDKAHLEAKFVELAKWQNKIDTFVANTRR